MEWREGDIDIGGCRIHYYRRGTGRPLVLAHGASDNGRCWERFARAVEDQYEVVAYDARYHGRSGAPEGGSLGGGEDLVGLVEGLALERPAVAGHSMGAMSVAEAAGSRPELFRCAVLEDPPWRDSFPANREPPVDTSGYSYEQMLEYGRSIAPSWHPDEFPAWAESKLQFRPPADWRASFGKRLRNWRETAAAIGVPALLVTGGNEAAGAIVTAEVAAEARRLNPRIEVVRFEGAGHNVRREAFEPFVAAVSAFLARHDRGDGGR